MSRRNCEAGSSSRPSRAAVAPGCDVHYVSISLRLGDVEWHLAARRRGGLHVRHPGQDAHVDDPPEHVRVDRGRRLLGLVGQLQAEGVPQLGLPRSEHQHGGQCVQRQTDEDEYSEDPEIDVRQMLGHGVLLARSRQASEDEREGVQYQSRPGGRVCQGADRVEFDPDVRVAERLGDLRHGRPGGGLDFAFQLARNVFACSSACRRAASSTRVLSSGGRLLGEPQPRAVLIVVEPDLAGRHLVLVPRQANHAVAGAVARGRRQRPGPCAGCTCT